MVGFRANCTLMAVLLIVAKTARADADADDAKTACPSTPPEYTRTWSPWVSQASDGSNCGGTEARTSIWECNAEPGCCADTPERELQVQPQGPCEGNFANFELSGIPKKCQPILENLYENLYGESFLTGEWLYQENTADGRPYYAWGVHDALFSTYGYDDDDLWQSSDGSGTIESVLQDFGYFMYFDKSCGGSGGTGGSAWYIGQKRPSTTAAHNLAGGSVCNGVGYYSDQSVVPSSGQWNIACEEGFVEMPITLKPICPSTPNYTYTLGEWIPQQINGTTPSCGGIEQRVAVEECSAPLGCCVNPNETTNTRTQQSCEGDVDVVLGGVRDSCLQDVNGEWQYVGRTADGQPHYKWWHAEAAHWHYMYYDIDCDGIYGLPPASGAWIIDTEAPNTTAKLDLNGDGECDVLARTDRVVASDAPPSGTWYVRCDGGSSGLTPETVTVMPSTKSCPDGTPKYTYNWSDWKPEQTDGTTCGGQDQREAVEVCAVGRGCCIDRETQATRLFRSQPACSETAVVDADISVALPDASLPPKKGGGTTAGTVVGIVLPLLLVVVLLLILLRKSSLKGAAAERAQQRAELFGIDTVEMQTNPHARQAIPSHRGRSDTMHNFASTIAQMVASGRLDALQARNKKIPVEIERGTITLISKIGNGQFGEVWKGMIDTSCTSGAPAYMVAVKTVIDPGASPEGLKELVQEAAVMAQVGTHPNLVGLVGVHTSTAEKMIVLSYCEHGSLLSVLREGLTQEGSTLSPSKKLSMMLEIARGMLHLASKRFVHRDLACRNVLVSSGMQCKVADFGLSRVAVKSSRSGSSSNDTGSNDEYYCSAAGSFPIRWTAPECMESMKFNELSDVWSFGVTMWECFSDGDRPYGQMSNMLVMMKVEQGYKLEKPSACSLEAYAVLVACLGSVSDRPMFVEVVDFIENLLRASGDADGGSVGRKIVGSVGGGGGGTAGYSTTTDTMAVAGYSTFQGNAAAGYAGVAATSATSAAAYTAGANISVSPYTASNARPQAIRPHRPPTNEYSHPQGLRYQQHQHQHQHQHQQQHDRPLFIPTQPGLCLTGPSLSARRDPQPQSHHHDRSTKAPASVLVNQTYNTVTTADYSLASATPAYHQPEHAPAHLNLHPRHPGQYQQQQQQQQTRQRADSTVSTYEGFGQEVTSGVMQQTRQRADSTASTYEGFGQEATSGVVTGGGGGSIQRGDRKPSLCLGFMHGEQSAQPPMPPEGEDETRL